MPGTGWSEERLAADDRDGLWTGGGPAGTPAGRVPGEREARLQGPSGPQEGKPC